MTVNSILFRHNDNFTTKTMLLLLLSLLLLSLLTLRQYPFVLVAATAGPATASSTSPLSPPFIDSNKRFKFLSRSFARIQQQLPNRGGAVSDIVDSISCNTTFTSDANRLDHEEEDAKLAAAATTTKQQHNTKQRMTVVLGIDGGTESIRACFFDARNGTVVAMAAVPYQTYHPKSSYAEQDPNDWWNACGTAVRQAVQLLYQRVVGVEDNDSDNELLLPTIAAITIDTTCCSVVALNEQYEPIRNCLLWMDQRAAQQTQQMYEICYNDTRIRINNHGLGPISAEWMIPKVLWLYHNEYSTTYIPSHTICEYQDYMNYQMTGVMCSSTCNAITRWHYDGSKCSSNSSGSSSVVNDNDSSNDDGRPMSLYDKLGLSELANKLPKQCVPMGTMIGTLTINAAQHFGLSRFLHQNTNNTTSSTTATTTTITNIPVIQGGPDAFVGMIGLGCIEAKQLCLITGSSHLHCVVTSQPNTAPGIWGAYQNAPLLHMNFAEGGQSSTGSILRWAKRLFGGTDSNIEDSTNASTTITYKVLDEEAAAIPPGADGLLVLETFQGSRTPIADPLARGAMIGLTLSHTRAHIWRALMEAVCYGTRACIEGLEAAGHTCEEIIMAGGVTRSDIWLQMHADVTNKTITLCENSDAPLLGCAILGSVGAGIYNTVPDAVRAMVRTVKQVRPNATNVKTYSKLYNTVYKQMLPTLQPMFHTIHSIRGGAIKYMPNDCVVTTENSTAAEQDTVLASMSSANDPTITHRTKEMIIAPSLLACDWSNIEREVHRCCGDLNVIQYHLRHRLHIDIFDGVYLNSPYAFTFGPQMVSAIRKSIQSYYHTNRNHKHPFKNDATKVISLDLHLCVDRPSRFVQPMAKATTSYPSDTMHSVEGCFIFQWEAMEQNISNSIQLIEQVMNSGMKCGISINPSTSVEEIYPLLLHNQINVVNVLGVEPGFGGQYMQSTRTIRKVQSLYEFRSKHTLHYEIMVDGGINMTTYSNVRDAGTDIVVVGTFLFQYTNLQDGIMALQNGGKQS